MQRYSIVLAFVIASSFACEGEKPATPPPAPATAPAAPPPKPANYIDPAKLAVYLPIPKEVASDANPTSPEKVDLGHHLFFEAGLSSNGKVACESCHVLEKFGTDGLATAKGMSGKPLKRNTPTVFNVALASSFGWDGHSASLEDFLKEHLADAEIMGTTDKELAALAKRGYTKLFAGADPSSKDPATSANAVNALGAYVRGLVTPSPWDKFLAGNTAALTDEQKKGFNTFADSGCMTCHGGVAVGGMLEMKLGLIKPWPAPAKGEQDQGKFEATKQDGDKLMFRSAPLRNVAKTGPYSVDGAIDSLDEMARRMADHQVGKQLQPADTASIAQFLGALTGELPATLIAKPAEVK